MTVNSKKKLLIWDGSPYSAFLAFKTLTFPKASLTFVTGPYRPSASIRFARNSPCPKPHSKIRYPSELRYSGETEINELKIDNPVGPASNASFGSWLAISGFIFFTFSDEIYGGALTTIWVFCLRERVSNGSYMLA